LEELERELSRERQAIIHEKNLMSPVLTKYSQKGSLLFRSFMKLTTSGIWYNSLGS
jgi:hypothetical protein